MNKNIVLLLWAIMPTVSFSLDNLITWGEANPNLYKSTNRCLQVAKGVADDNLYILEVDPITGGLPVTTTDPARTMSYKGRLDYTSTNVTTSAYVQLTASTSADIKKLHIFDSSGQTLVLATGGAGSEVDLLYIVPGGDTINVYIPSGTRLSVKAVSATANSGELTINATN